MAWKNVSPMEEKMRFVSLAESGRFEVVGLCREFGISRKTGYKWLGRYREFGSEGLKDQSRAPKSQAGKTRKRGQSEHLIKKQISNRRRGGMPKALRSESAGFSLSCDEPREQPPVDSSNLNPKMIHARTPLCG